MHKLGKDNSPILRLAGSIRPDARELDHLAPLVCFFGDELDEVEGRAWKYGAGRAVAESVRRRAMAQARVRQGAAQGRLTSVRVFEPQPMPMSCSILDRPNVLSYNSKIDPIKPRNPSRVGGLCLALAG
jgi:hypothetical protein